MPVIELPTGIPQHYLDPNPEGETAVLLLHGLGATGESWQPQFPALIEAGFRPIAVDARGFGQTPNPDRRWSQVQVARDMDALLAALDIPSAHAVGISMGGTLALQLALDFPRRVQRLVLVNTFARLKPTSPFGWLYFFYRYLLVRFVSLETQAKLVAGRTFPKAEHEDLRQMLIEQIRQADPRSYRAAMLTLATFDVLDWLPTVQAPTLVVTGDQDTTVPPPAQRHLVEGIPNARQVVIQGAGHAVTADSPGEFNRVLLEFLTDQTN